VTQSGERTDGRTNGRTDRRTVAMVQLHQCWEQGQNCQYHCITNTLHGSW